MFVVGRSVRVRDLEQLLCQWKKPVAGGTTGAGFSDVRVRLFQVQEQHSVHVGSRLLGPEVVPVLLVHTVSSHDTGQ